MQQLADRLRAARRKVGLSQEAFGSWGNVSRAAQFSYETGKSAPDASYLAAIASHGVDVVEVLTGHRQTDSLDPWQAQIIDELSALDDEWRDVIVALIRKAVGRTQAGGPTLHEKATGFRPEGS